MAGQSMMPLLNSGDVVLVNRLIYDFAKPNRLDVVVFEREDKKTNVKRVIGLPGDVVQVQGGYLYVNGERLNAGNRLDQVSLAGLAENPVELGEGEYFLLGDNRDSSEDSRFANVGNVRQEQILGKVWLRIFPIKDFGPVRSHYQERPLFPIFCITVEGGGISFEHTMVPRPYGQGETRDARGD